MSKSSEFKPENNLPLYTKALKIFKIPDKVTHWFNKPNKSFNGQKPVDLLNTAEGIKLVEQVLGRIQHGVHS